MQLGVCLISFVCSILYIRESMYYVLTGLSILGKDWEEGQDRHLLLILVSDASS